MPTRRDDSLLARTRDALPGRGRRRPRLALPGLGRRAARPAGAVRRAPDPGAVGDALR